MSRGKSAKLKSITLVELIVAMGITVFIIGASVPLILKNNKTNVLEDQGEIAASFVERAKNFAMHPETKHGEEAEAYGVDCINSRRLQVKWRGKDGKFDNVDGEILELPSEFIIACETNSPVFFNLYSGEYTGAPYAINITREGKNKPEANVTVQKPGRIDVKIIEK